MWVDVVKMDAGPRYDQSADALLKYNCTTWMESFKLSRRQD